jgi:hypothetical protein
VEVMENFLAACLEGVEGKQLRTPLGSTQHLEWRKTPRQMTSRRHTERWLSNIIRTKVRQFNPCFMCNTILTVGYRRRRSNG